MSSTRHYNYGDKPGTTHSPPCNIGLPFNSPPVVGYFFGTFGAGNFATDVTSNTCPYLELGPGCRTTSGYYGGGVLGQTIVPGLTQGYVVAANGQREPGVRDVTARSRSTASTSRSAGRTMQPVTPCSPCVTVGLTTADAGPVLGERRPTGWPGTAGVIPWAAHG